MLLNRLLLKCGQQSPMTGMLMGRRALTLFKPISQAPFANSSKQEMEEEDAEEVEIIVGEGGVVR